MAKDESSNIQTIITSTAPALSLNFDHVERLTGQSNYITWKNVMRVYLDYLDVWDVVDGTIKKPDHLAGDAAVKAWKNKDRLALAALISFVDPKHHLLVAISGSSAEAWTTLERRFDQKDLFSLTCTLSQSMSYRYDRSTTISGFLSAWEDMWIRLKDRCSYAESSDPIAILYRLLDSDDMKASSLIEAISDAFPEVAEILRRQDLSFDDAYRKIRDIASGRIETDAPNKVRI